MAQQQIVNIEKLKVLVEKLGRHAISKVTIDADVSHSTIRDALRGKVPGPESRVKLAKFFKKKEKELFPMIDSGES